MTKRRRVNGKRRGPFRKDPDLKLKLPTEEKQLFEKHSYVDIIPGKTTSKNIKDIMPLGLHGGANIKINPTEDFSLSAGVSGDITRRLADPNIKKTTTSSTDIKSLIDVRPSFNVSFNKKFKNLQLSARYSKGKGSQGHLGFGIIKKF